MRDSDYYAPGSYNDPNAPWNEVEVPEKDFEVTCCQTLSRTAVVTTNNYVPCVDEGCEDGIGYHDEWEEFPDTCWSDEYRDNGYQTPLQLIQMFQEYLEKDLENVEETAKNTNQNKAFLKRKLEFLIEECKCWNEDETEYCKD